MNSKKKKKKKIVGKQYMYIFLYLKELDFDESSEEKKVIIKKKPTQTVLPLIIFRSV